MERAMIAPAKLVGGKIYINQYERWVLAPDVISTVIGEADSIGFAIIGEEQTRYITKTQVDAAFLLQEAKDVLAELTALSQQVIAITRAQYVIAADNAQWGVNDNLTPIGDAVEALVGKQNDIAGELADHKLI